MEFIDNTYIINFSSSTFCDDCAVILRIERILDSLPISSRFTGNIVPTLSRKLRRHKSVYAKSPYCSLSAQGSPLRIADDKCINFDPQKAPYAIRASRARAKPNRSSKTKQVLNLLTTENTFFIQLFNSIQPFE